MIVCHADLCHFPAGHVGPHQTDFMNRATRRPARCLEELELPFEHDGAPVRFYCELEQDHDGDHERRVQLPAGGSPVVVRWAPR